MTNAPSLYKLLAWLSPSYPIGAYTYSHGIEYGVEAGLITSAEETEIWISNIIEGGAGYSDAVFLGAAYDATREKNERLIIEASEVASCFSASKELSLETQAQGDAFLEITSKAWPCEALSWFTELWQGPYPYPILIGVAAAGHDIDRGEAIHAYLHGLAANLVSAATRLVPLGQTDGQKIIARLEAIIASTAQRARAVPLEDVSNNALMVDICSMKHESQHTRLFRS